MSGLRICPGWFNLINTFDSPGQSLVQGLQSPTKPKGPNQGELEGSGLDLGLEVNSVLLDSD